MADVKLVNVTKVYPYANRADKKSALQKMQDPAAQNGGIVYTEDGVVAVHKFNLDIEDKEFIVLVGPSGCGKSTTLRMIAGLEEISAGELYIGGRLVNEVAPKDRDIAMVFQNYALYPHMTVFDNMAFSLQLRKEPKAKIIQKVKRAAEILDISDLLDRKPKALSGGQRQRVAIGRAIVRDPQVFLMDEPLSNLDAKLRNQMRAEIIQLRQRLATTFVYVTHDQTEAITLGDRIVIMKDGFIQQTGTPQEVFEQPRNIFVAGFIGIPQMNIFRGWLKRQNGDYYLEYLDQKFPLDSAVSQRLAAKQQDEQAVDFGVRPEHITLCLEEQSGPHIKSRLLVSEMMGSSINLHIKTASDEDAVIVVQMMDLPAEKRFSFKVGEELNFSFGGDFVHLFDPETGLNLLS